MSWKGIRLSCSPCTLPIKHVLECLALCPVHSHLPLPHTLMHAALQLGMRGATSPMFSYSCSKGAFVGAALQGTVMLVRSAVNEKFYGEGLGFRPVQLEKYNTWFHGDCFSWWVLFMHAVPVQRSLGTSQLHCMTPVAPTYTLRSSTQHPTRHTPPACIAQVTALMQHSCYWRTAYRSPRQRRCCTTRCTRCRRSTKCARR